MQWIKNLKKLKKIMFKSYFCFSLDNFYKKWQVFYKNIVFVSF